MKKNILIIFLLLITVVFMIYAAIKANEAEKSREYAMASMNEAMAEKERAEALMEIARVKAEEAIMAQGEAEQIHQQLQECQNQ